MKLTLKEKFELQKVAREGTERLQAGIADPDERQKVQDEVRDALDKLTGETTPREQQGETKPAKPWRATIRPKPTLEEYKRLLAGDYNHLPPEEFWEAMDSICTAEAAKRFEFWGTTPTPDELEKKTVDLMKRPAMNYLDIYYDEELDLFVYEENKVVRHEKN